MGHWDGWVTFLAGFGCGFVAVFVLVPLCLWAGWVKMSVEAKTVVNIEGGGDRRDEADWWKGGDDDDDGRD